jgi:hypothetical protein
MNSKDDRVPMTVDVKKEQEALLAARGLVMDRVRALAPMATVEQMERLEELLDEVTLAGNAHANAIFTHQVTNISADIGALSQPSDVRPPRQFRPHEPLDRSKFGGSIGEVGLAVARFWCDVIALGVTEAQVEECEQLFKDFAQSSAALNAALLRPYCEQLEELLYEAAPTPTSVRDEVN